jgi:O-antigen chain-terminating methyltransferase
MEPEDSSTQMDVAGRMSEIRKRIEEKRKSGLYSDEDLKTIENLSLRIDSDESQDREGDIFHHLSRVNYLCDTGRPPELTSHRRLLGPLAVGLKRALHKLTNPYIQMILKRQVAFNSELVRLLNQIVMDYRYGLASLEKQMTGLEEKLAKAGRLLEELPQELRSQKRVFEEVLEELKARKGKAPETGAWSEGLRERVRSHEYLRFENLHRGREEDIKWKQKAYLPYFKDKGMILDIGCGRGEFLELLKEAGLTGSGIEINPEMVAHCRTKGLDVREGDGLHYLKGLPDNGLGGIFLSQVIEHLDPETLREWAGVCFAKLSPGGVLLAETVNPQCLTTFSGAFYLDLSHQKPVHPEAARFLWESLGFRQVTTLFVSPYPEEMKLREMARREDDSYEDELARVLNENTRRLNDLLYGYQDYAVIGYK